MDVRPLADAGVDEIASCIDELDVKPEGATRAVTPGGAPFAVWIPNRRKEHGLVFTSASSVTPEGAIEAFCLTAQDLLAVGDADQTMSEYCGYLSQSYENMAMVYRLVRLDGRHLVVGADRR